MKTLLLFILLSTIDPGEPATETPSIIPENSILISSLEENFKCQEIDYIPRDYDLANDTENTIGRTIHDTPTKLANQLTSNHYKFVVIHGQPQSGKTVALKKIQHVLHTNLSTETWSILLNLPKIVPREPTESWQPESIFSSVLSPEEFNILNNTIIPQKPEKLYVLLDNIDGNLKALPRILRYIDELLSKGVRVVATKTHINYLWTRPKVSKLVKIPSLRFSEIKKYLTEHWDVEFGLLTHYKHVHYADAVVEFVKMMKIHGNFGKIKSLKELMSSNSSNVFTKNQNFITINNYVHEKTINPEGLKKMFKNIEIPRPQLLEALYTLNTKDKKLFTANSNPLTAPRSLKLMGEKLNSSEEHEQVEENKNPNVKNVETSLKRDILFSDKPSLRKYQAILAETLPEFLTQDICNDLLFLAVAEGDWREMKPIILDLKTRCASPEKIIVKNETLMHVAVRKRDFQLVKFLVEELNLKMKEVAGTKSLFITILDVNPLPLYSSPSFWKIIEYFIEFGEIKVPQPTSIELNYSKVKPTIEDVSSDVYKFFTHVNNKNNSNQTLSNISWDQVDKLSSGVREYRRNLVLTRGLSKYNSKNHLDNTTLLEVLLKYRSIEILNISEEAAYKKSIFRALKYDLQAGELTYDQEFRIGRALVDSIGNMDDLKFVISFLFHSNVSPHFTSRGKIVIFLRLIERIEMKPGLTVKRSLESAIYQTRAKYYLMENSSSIIEELKSYIQSLIAQRTVSIV